MQLGEQHVLVVRRIGLHAVADAVEEPRLQESVEERLAIFREQYETIGKVRIRQVIGTGKHHVIVLLETEREEGYLLNELEVEEDYPHRITVFGDVEEE